MCIRDRDNDYRSFLKNRVEGIEEKLADGLFVNTEGKVLGKHRGYPFYTIGPVSYTHLRAHETVLDLVCRLLLEKKQNTLIIQSSITTISYNYQKHIHIYTANSNQ